MSAPENISRIQQALNDLNSTRRLARFLADHLPTAAQLGPDDNGDSNLWCVFEVIADRLESIEGRLETELATGRPKNGPTLVEG